MDSFYSLKPRGHKHMPIGLLQAIPSTPNVLPGFVPWPFDVGARTQGGSGYCIDI